MNTNYLYQVIRSNNLFVIHEYLFGVLNKGYVEPLSELTGALHRIPHHAHELAVIHCSDSQVCKQSQVPDVKPKDILR